MTSLLPPGRGRRTAASAVTLALAAAGLTAALTTAAPAQAAPDGPQGPGKKDDANTLTVVGTSDVFDSFLVQTVIKPGFEAAFPQYTLNYVSRGTGAAIAFAKAGTASAMIVHAASLENQFVADGYSEEQFGRAIFWGDYVLLGPSSDPAGVMTDAPHDIVTAFERIAATGADGDAEFVSRGGTPGTTVQEHAIWALTDGVQTCDVSAANGGGRTPSTQSGTCANPVPLPSWYHTTGLTQGPNVLAGDACNGYDSEACYVFTDRGTFNYLDSQGSISDLEVVTRDNDVQGQEDLLINSFHAYAIDDDKFADNPNVQINTQGALDFLDWITSPDAQDEIGQYLADQGGDEPDPPFIPSAAPAIDVDPIAPTTDAGDRLTVSGTIENVTPGTPALADQPVQLFGQPADDPDATPVQLKATRTGADGSFSFRLRPTSSTAYTVRTPQLTQIEDADLDPVFGDLLAPASADAGSSQVQSAVTLDSARGTRNGVRLTGDLAPRTTGSTGRLVLLAARPGGKFAKKGTAKLPVLARSFDEGFKLGKGTWRVKVTYRNGSFVLPSTSAAKRVTVP